MLLWLYLIGIISTLLAFYFLACVILAVNRYDAMASKTDEIKNDKTDKIKTITLFLICAFLWPMVFVFGIIWALAYSYWPTLENWYYKKKLGIILYNEMMIKVRNDDIKIQNIERYLIYDSSSSVSRSLDAECNILSNKSLFDYYKEFLEKKC